MTTSQTRDRIDWRTERDRIDLATIATGLLGPAPGRMGERGSRLWWSCPFHEDRNPSFMVKPGKPGWKCYGCGESGDAATLVMKLEGLSFPEAVALLAGRAGFLGTTTPRPKSKPSRAMEGPKGLPEAEALSLVEEAATRLWKPEGGGTLAYLAGSRGLSLGTIRDARIGFTAGVGLATKDGRSYWARGVVIPWFDGDRLTLVKIRQPDGDRPKYAEAFRDRPSLYPGRRVIRPGRPLIIVEGEFDALLLGQELADLAAVVTLGSASARPDPGILGTMLAAPRWSIATDADDAGDKAAEGWPSRATRVRPPEPFIDWTEAHQGGINLRRWWSDLLGGIEATPLFTWDELAPQRWRPAIGDPSPGIIID